MSCLKEVRSKKSNLYWQLDSTAARVVRTLSFSLAFFGLSVVLMIISILLYVIETQQSHLALSNHVNELKNIQE